MKWLLQSAAPFLSASWLLVGSLAPLQAQSEGFSREPDDVGAVLKAEAANPNGFVKAARSPEALSWVRRGEGLAAAGKYPQAAEAFRTAAQLYNERGLPDMAAGCQMQAHRYETIFKLFYHRRSQPDSIARYNTRRRLEPTYGAYLGAFIQNEEGLEAITDASGRVFRDSNQFNQLVGKKHALFLTYARYGASMPAEWFGHLRSAGAGVVLAIEPEDIQAVRDDETLHTLADQLNQAHIPVFLRFGSEMNGVWTPWHRDAALYKQKFRLVADYIHRHCPNVAMVWCPNDIPEDKIPAYYPGEEVVDWVGVNFYVTYYRNNNRHDAIPWRNPADKLAFIYDHYASRHPIMIGETGAAYQQSCDGQMRNDYAQDKINQLYLALPRRYPRVKAVTYFSLDGIKYAENPERRINNYSLVENETVRRHYAKVIAPRYFLSRVAVGNGSREVSPTEYVELTDGAVLSDRVPLSAYIKTYAEHPEVTYKLNGKLLAQFTDGGPNSFQLDTRALSNGPGLLSVEVRAQGSLVAQRSVHVVIRNAARSAAR
jgi:hypothetical protein